MRSSDEITDIGRRNSSNEKAFHFILNEERYNGEDGLEAYLQIVHKVLVGKTEE